MIRVRLLGRRHLQLMGHFRLKYEKKSPVDAAAIAANQLGIFFA